MNFLWSCLSAGASVWAAGVLNSGFHMVGCGRLFHSPYFVFCWVWDCQWGRDVACEGCDWLPSSLLWLTSLNIDWGIPTDHCILAMLEWDDMTIWNFCHFTEATDSPLAQLLWQAIACHKCCASRLWKSLVLWWLVGNASQVRGGLGRCFLGGKIRRAKQQAAFYQSFWLAEGHLNLVKLRQNGCHFEIDKN